MKSELTEERLEEINREKAGWVAIVQQWKDLMPLDPVPMFTKQYAQKMIKKLDKDEG